MDRFNEQLVEAGVVLEAMRLGRLLAALAPGESEAQALVALMEIQASLLRSRTAPNGAIVTLDKQDRARATVPDQINPTRRTDGRGRTHGWRR